jgi:hypothetical protein
LSRGWAQRRSREIYKSFHDSGVGFLSINGILYVLPFYLSSISTPMSWETNLSCSCPSVLHFFLSTTSHLSGTTLRFELWFCAFKADLKRKFLVIIIVEHRHPFSEPWVPHPGVSHHKLQSIGYVGFSGACDMGGVPLWLRRGGLVQTWEEPGMRL